MGDVTITDPTESQIMWGVSLHFSHAAPLPHPTLTLFTIGPMSLLYIWYTFGALITMFKLTCCDSWVNELSSTDEKGSTNFGVASFIMSYIVMAVWTVLQVTGYEMSVAESFNQDSSVLISI